MDLPPATARTPPIAARDPLAPEAQRAAATGAHSEAPTGSVAREARAKGTPALPAARPDRPSGAATRWADIVDADPAGDAQHQPAGLTYARTLSRPHSGRRARDGDTPGPSGEPARPRWPPGPRYVRGDRRSPLGSASRLRRRAPRTGAPAQEPSTLLETAGWPRDGAGRQDRGLALEDRAHDGDSPPWMRRLAPGSPRSSLPPRP